MNYEQNEFQSNCDGFNINNATDVCDSIYHPYRRFFARLFDSYIVSFLFIFLIFFFFFLYQLIFKSNVEPHSTISSFLFLLVHLLLNFFYSAFFLSLIGATPGKALLGIEVVKQDGNKLSFYEAFMREFYLFLHVYFISFIMGILAIYIIILTVLFFKIDLDSNSIFPPILFFICVPIGFFLFLYPLLYQMRRLKNKHQTSYDAKLQCNVICKKFSILKIFGFFGFSFIIIICLSIMLSL